MFMKTRYLDEQHAGHGVTFGDAGTPISNSLMEAYTMPALSRHRRTQEPWLEHFDAWAATFGEVIETLRNRAGRRWPAAT